MNDPAQATAHGSGSSSRLSQARVGRHHRRALQAERSGPRRGRRPGTGREERPMRSPAVRWTEADMAASDASLMMCWLTGPCPLAPPESRRQPARRVEIAVGLPEDASLDAGRRPRFGPRLRASRPFNSLVRAPPTPYHQMRREEALAPQECSSGLSLMLTVELSKFSRPRSKARRSRCACHATPPLRNAEEQVTRTMKASRCEPVA
jgi:hypothetical protein